MGWQLAVLRPTLPMAHGPLMVCGFLGTLVGLERAVGLSGLDSRQRWTYIGPAATGIGSLLLILGIAWPVGTLLIVLGSVVLVLAMVVILRIHVALYSVVMLLGALAWLGGNLLWMFGRSIPDVSLWWAGFLVLTIVGERLELSRMLRLSQRQAGRASASPPPSGGRHRGVACWRLQPASGWPARGCCCWPSGCCSSTSPGARCARPA